MARKIMKEFRLDEISIVDRPAQEHAKITIAKRALTKAIAITSPSDGHAHLITTRDERSGITSYVAGHSHDWLLDDSGNIVLAEAEGHTHGVGVMVKSLTEEQLAVLEGAQWEQASKTAGTAGDSGGRMTDQNKKAAEELAAAQEELKVLKAELAEAKQLAELTDAEKEFLKGLDDKAKFLALDAKEREAELAKAEDADPVVYTTEDGLEIRKSAGDVVLALAKKADQELKARQELEKKAADADLAKRASELKLPGGEDAKKALLKALDSLSGDEQKAALELLSVNTERLEQATKQLGTKKSDSDSDPVEAIAEKLRKEDPKLTQEQAYAKALQTPEGLAAFNKMRSV
jgi:hypothetical protein